MLAYMSINSMLINAFSGIVSIVTEGEQEAQL